MTNGKNYYLPREIFTSSGQPDRKSGNRYTRDVKKSAEGIVDKTRATMKVEDSHTIEGRNLLTKESIEDA